MPKKTWNHWKIASAAALVIAFAGVDVVAQELTREDRCELPDDEVWAFFEVDPEHHPRGLPRITAGEPSISPPRPFDRAVLTELPGGEWIVRCTLPTSQAAKTWTELFGEPIPQRNGPAPWETFCWEAISAYHKVAAQMRRAPSAMDRDEGESLLAIVGDLYAFYRQTYPDSARLYEASFLHGEVLSHLQRWKEAIDAYDAALAIDQSGPYTGDILHALVLADLAQADGAEASSAQVVPDRVKRWIEQIDAYVIDAADDDFDSRVLRLALPKLLLRYGVFDEALRRAEALAIDENYPMTREAVELHFEIAARQGSQAVLERIIASYRECGCQAREHANWHLERLEVEQALAPCFQAQAVGKACVALGCFLDVAKRFPGRHHVDGALHEAIGLLEELGQPYRALELKSYLLVHHPGSSHAAELMKPLDLAPESVVSPDKEASVGEIVPGARFFTEGFIRAPFVAEPSRERRP